MQGLRYSSQPETGQAGLGGDWVRDVVGDAWELGGYERRGGARGEKDS